MTNYIDLMTEAIPLIAGILTIWYTILMLRDYYRISKTNPQAPYSNGTIDNRSITFSKSYQTVNYISVSPQSSDGKSIGAILTLMCLTARLLYQYITILRLAFLLICLGTLMLLLHFNRKSVQAGVPQQQYMAVCAVSYILCFAGLALIDESLVFKASNGFRGIVHVSAIIGGMALIPFVVFNPWGKTEKAFREGMQIIFSVKETLEFLAPAVLSFLFCSGIFINFFEMLKPQL